MDPALDFRSTFVPWSPEIFPRQLFVGASPAIETDPLAALDLLTAGREQTNNDRVLRAPKRAFHVMAPEGWPEELPALIVPMDRDLTNRLAEAQSLSQLLDSGGKRPLPDLLTGQRRQRLALELRALDAAIAGAAYREIAGGLFGRRRLPDRGWKTHDLRSRTIRLVRNARTRMRGAYRKLLHIPPRR